MLLANSNLPQSPCIPGYCLQCVEKAGQLSLAFPICILELTTHGRGAIASRVLAIAGM